jgi:hypothetical protein
LGAAALVCLLVSRALNFSTSALRSSASRCFEVIIFTGGFFSCRPFESDDVLERLLLDPARDVAFRGGARFGAAARGWLENDESLRVNKGDTGSDDEVCRLIGGRGSDSDARGSLLWYDDILLQWPLYPLEPTPNFWGSPTGF